MALQPVPDDQYLVENMPQQMRKQLHHLQAAEATDAIQARSGWFVRVKVIWTGQKEFSLCQQV